ncbi:MAG: hypothetical protein WCJ64_04405 [Rhodospirillaceae bacterium]
MQDTNAPSIIEIAPGRALPQLLVLTNLAKLESKFGLDGLNELSEAARTKGLTINDAHTWTDIKRFVETTTAWDGVLLIGGHDIIPSVALDVLPPELKKVVGTDFDPDKWVVWSDDHYADFNGDGYPDVPVSRIPDIGSLSFVKACLQAVGASTPVSRFGIRNSKRPYAEIVFSFLPGTQPILVSTPTIASSLSPSEVCADQFYAVLHGADTRADEMMGEDDAGNCVTALDVASVGYAKAKVVMLAGCWSNRHIREPAAQVPSTGPNFLSPKNSLALAFLARGSVAVVGPTGAHFSPREEPFTAFSGSIHMDFWEAVRKGGAPAQALYDAKNRKLKQIVKGGLSPHTLACEFKTLWQFTCLGLGW